MARIQSNLTCQMSEADFGSNRAQIRGAVAEMSQLLLLIIMGEGAKPFCDR